MRDIDILKKVNEQAIRNHIINESRDEVWSDSFETDADTFVIGDYCYIVDDDRYFDTWEKQLDFNQGIIYENYEQEDEKPVALIHSTYIGDGGYDSKSGINYGVDAGNLSIVDYRFANNTMVKKSKLLRKIKIKSSTDTNKVTLTYNKGKFSFIINGKVIEEIETA